MGQIREDVRFLLLVIVGAILLGFFINGLRDDPLPFLREVEDLRLARTVSDGALVKIREETSVINFDDTVAAFEEARSVLVDARQEAFFGLGHIPGARNLPRSEFRSSFGDFAVQIAQEESLIVYCSDAECEDSAIVAKALMRLGYRRVLVFKGGWEEWTAAGLSQEP